MKKIIFAISIYLASCNNPTQTSNQKTESISMDTLRKQYIFNDIMQKNMVGKNALFFIYPSFCGACSDSIMVLIKNNPLKSFHPYYIYPCTDSLDSHVVKFSNGITKFMDAYEMGRHGLEAAHNQIFLFTDTVCMYHAKLSAETVPQVRKELAAIESNEQ